MFEIDKSQFGAFLSSQRKKQGYTQKELAKKLYISDKAVSKWERGISLPDISLLMPLAALLGVTVTELLEGHAIQSTDAMDTAQVENLVKKALSYSEGMPQGQILEAKKQKQKHRIIFASCFIIAALELAAFLFVGSRSQSWHLAILSQALGSSFGAHFWLTAKERLPSYYDENHLSHYQDGLFQMSLPGIRIYNGNWPSILRAGRIWSALSMAVFPACYFGISCLLPDAIWGIIGPFALLIFLLASFFIPLYLIGQKAGDA